MISCTMSGPVPTDFCRVFTGDLHMPMICMILFRVDLQFDCGSTHAEFYNYSPITSLSLYIYSFGVVERISEELSPV